MTSLESLLSKADANSIPVFELNLVDSDSMVADMGNDHAAICLNSQIQSEKVAAEKAAHELGHVFTGTYYDSSYCRNNRGKMERQANVWAVKELLSPETIRAAWKDGCCKLWEVAEYCNRSEDFTRMAIEIYRAKGLL